MPDILFSIESNPPITSVLEAWSAAGIPTGPWTHEDDSYGWADRTHDGWGENAGKATPDDLALLFGYGVAWLMPEHDANLIYMGTVFPDEERYRVVTKAWAVEHHQETIGTGPTPLAACLEAVRAVTP